jgi:hypothetical protein
VPPEGRCPSDPRFPYHKTVKKSTSKVVDIGKKNKYDIGGYAISSWIYPDFNLRRFSGETHY